MVCEVKKDMQMMIHLLKYVSLLAVCLLGAATLHAQDSEPGVAITLERTACFGACPIYTVTIFEDGTVRYNGERFVDVTGEQTSEIEPETVARMVEAFENAGYFDWDEAYDEMTITDAPSVITSVTRDGETHRIHRYTGDSSAPLALAFLEAWIDEMANTQQWTGVQPDISALSYGMDTPVATLQRTACFGACPVYSVALYADGTVAYVGIANVDDIGVHIFQGEGDAVESVAQRATISGYFDWQDSYEAALITDQSTVITSVRTDDAYKRISRYLGDPNAPVGLVWVEDSIDQLVTSLAGE